MTNKYTPAPWAVGIMDDFNGSYTVIQKGSERKGFGYIITVDICDNASEENAHLIAAAPELLEALEALLCHVENNLSSDYPTGIDVNDHKFQSAHAAIAKARGTTE